MIRIRDGYFDDIYEAEMRCEMKQNTLNNREYRVIINDPAVILFVEEFNPITGIRSSKKYVSKAHNEKFDAEKGLLMCLAKANGISHLELKRMLKGATGYKESKPKSEVKVVKTIIKKK